MNNESMAVPVDNKNFVGIGKMTFDSNAEWNIPHLHFMVDKILSLTPSTVTYTDIKIAA